MTPRTHDDDRTEAPTDRGPAADSEPQSTGDRSLAGVLPGSSRRDFLRLTAGAGALAAGLGASTPAAAAEEVCGEDNGSIVIDDDFTLLMNQWGQPEAEQCIRLNDDGTYGYDFDATGLDTGAINYPEVFIGTRPWGSDTGVPEFPLRRGDVDELVIEVEADTSHSGGEWDWAEEWWLLEQPVSEQTETHQYEIMLLLDWSDDHDHGAVTEEAAWTDQFGNTVDHWTTYNSGGTSATFYIFRIQGGHDGGQIDLAEIVDFLTTDHGVSEDLLISGIELGNEYWGGTSGETTYQQFDVSVNGSTYTSVSGGNGGDTTAPTAPSNPSVTGTTTTSVDVSWDASTDAGGSGLDSYVVSVDGTQDQTVAAGTTSATVSGLSAGTSYEIGVTAVDGAGNESGQATVTATTEDSSDTEAPTAPSNLSASGASSTSIDVSWDASTDAGGSGIDGYVVSVDGSQDHQVDAGSTSTTVTGLSAGTSYEIGVSAVDAAGNESDTATTTATTDEGEEPPPEDLIAEMDPSTTTPEVGETVSFQVTDTTDAGNWITGLEWDLGNGDTDSGWYTETTYDAEDTYTAALTATNNEDASTTHEVDVEVGDGGGENQDDTEAPSAPSNVSASGASSSSIDASWDAATDSGGSGLDHYDVSVDGSQDHQVAAGTTSTTVTGLDPETTYEIGVSAVDGAGNESSQVTATATTEPDDGEPTDLLAELNPSATSAGVGDRLTFSVTDTSGSGQWITALDWTFGDGTTATGWWNDHSYGEAGTYTVALTATDNEGDSTTHEVTITIS